MCPYSEDRERLRTHYPNHELLRVVRNHEILPQFKDPTQWTGDNSADGYFNWQGICAYKSAVRREALRRGLEIT